MNIRPKFDAIPFFFSQGDNTSQIFEYLKKTLWCYLSTILIATAICLILIYVMRWIATQVVWFSIFLMLSVFLTGK